MGSKRQKTRLQLELAFEAEGEGEALRTALGGTELPGTGSDAERQVLDGPTMEEVCQRDNVERALRHVMRNKGSAGVDGMTVDELPGYLSVHWGSLKQQLLDGTYKPAPVKRVEIPKPDGGVRKLGIPTVLDRFIQQAMLQVLQPQWDPTFSAHSYGFRPGRSAHQAVAQAQAYLVAGYTWVVDMDLEKFFDRVNHDKLMGRVAKRVTDKRMLRVVRAYLTAGVLEGGLVSPTEEGTPQGGPLSPLLSNLMLDDLDRELERRGHRFVRYADDCNIYVRSERAGQRVMAGVTEFVERKLKLRVNREKSAVGRPWERKFLGFTFTEHGTLRTVAAKALARCKQKVRELTGRNRGQSVMEMTGAAGRYLRGWVAYFGFCQTPRVLSGLWGWVRRRLRAVIWKQLRTGHRRYQELRGRGVSYGLAARAASSSHGPWRMSSCQAMHVAFGNAYFASLGLPQL